MVFIPLSIQPCQGGLYCRSREERVYEISEKRNIFTYLPISFPFSNGTPPTCRQKGGILRDSIWYSPAPGITPSHLHHTPPCPVPSSTPMYPCTLFPTTMHGGLWQHSRCGQLHMLPEDLYYDCKVSPTAKTRILRAGKRERL